MHTPARTVGEGPPVECTKPGVVVAIGSALENDADESPSLAPSSLALNALLVFLSLMVFGEKSPCAVCWLTVERLDMLELEAKVLLLQLGGGDEEGDR